MGAEKAASPFLEVIEIDDESIRANPAPFLLWDTDFGAVMDGLNAASPKALAIDVLWLKSVEDFVELKAGSLRKPLVKALLNVHEKKRLVLAAPQNGTEPSLGKYSRLLGTEPFAAVNPELDADHTVRFYSGEYPAVDAAGRISTIPTMAALAVEKAGHAPLPAHFLIDYEMKPSFARISFHEVLTHARDRDFMDRNFSGKLVFLGTTSSLLDRHATPLGSETPGLYIHAFAAQTLLEERNFQFLPESGKIGILFLLAGIVLLPAMLLGIGAGAGVLGLLVAAYALLTQLLFNHYFVLPFAAPVVTLLFTFAVLLAYRFVFLDREKRQLTAIFKHYVNEKIVELLLASPDSARVGGSRRRVCVLFSDIRGFTQLSETLSPEQVVSFLNTYLSAMSEEILARDGTVDKFIGDGIMAYFGAPLENPDAAGAAVQAALGMQRRLAALNEQWQIEGKAALKIGIGMHFGDAIVGNIGSKLKMDYTAIGDAVNLASRVESLTKEMKREILVTDTVFECIQGRFQTEDMGEVPVRGHSAVRLFAIKGEKA